LKIDINNIINRLKIILIKLKMLDKDLMVKYNQIKIFTPHNLKFKTIMEVTR